MKKSCGSKIKHTCTGNLQYSTCVQYELELPEFSELGDCVSIEDTTNELYNLVGEIKTETDLSALGELCLEYTTVGGKNIVKNVLLKFEEKICELSEKVNLLENRPLCEMPLGDCVDTKCLVDACNENISTVGQLLQALVDLNCETP
jgi:hypothetical protein